MEEILKPSKWREGLLKAQQPMPDRRAIVYLRPDWGEYEEHAISFCKKFCEERDIKLLAEPFLDEDEYLNDLTILESLEFNKALEYCKDKKNRVNTLIVDKRDSLGTNTAEYLRCKTDLHREGVEILSMADVESVDSSMDEICAITDEYKNITTKK